MGIVIVISVVLSVNVDVMSNVGASCQRVCCLVCVFFSSWELSRSSVLFDCKLVVIISKLVIVIGVGLVKLASAFWGEMMFVRVIINSAVRKSRLVGIL